MEWCSLAAQIRVFIDIKCIYTLCELIGILSLSLSSATMFWILFLLLSYIQNAITNKNKFVCYFQCCRLFWWIYLRSVAHCAECHGLLLLYKWHSVDFASLLLLQLAVPSSPRKHPLLCPVWSLKCRWDVQGICIH